MKYKYQFKNKDLAKAVEVIFGEDNVEKILNQQIKDETKIILLTINRPDGIRSTTAIPKEEIERVRAYDPNNWNPISEFEPGFSGCYLVTREAGSTPVVDTAFFDKATNEWKPQNSTVTAFRELPEPYQPEPNK